MAAGAARSGSFSVPSFFPLKVKSGVCCYEGRFITRPAKEGRKEHFIIKRLAAAATATAELYKPLLGNKQATAI